MMSWVRTASAISLLVLATAVAAAQTTPPGSTPPPTPAPTTTTCTDVASCTAACNDGEGNLAACALAGDGLYWGRNNTAPDRAKALRFFRAACGLSIEATPAVSGPRPLIAPKPMVTPSGTTLPPPPPPSRGGAGTDFSACKAAANLHSYGWLFEVEPDARLAKLATDRAYTLAVAHCTDKDQTGCAIASWAARDLGPPGQADPAKDPAKDPVKLAEKGCTIGKRPESCVALRDLAFRGTTEAESQRIQNVSNAGLVSACTKDANLLACQKVGTYATPADSAAVIAAAAKQCTAGSKLACGIAATRTLSDNYRDIDKAKAAAKALADSCTPEAHELCTPVARLLSTGDTRLGIPADPATALAIAEKRCVTGDIDGCRIVANLRGAKGPDTTKDAAKASEFANRSCSLSLPTSFCGECKDEPTLAECKYRDAFREHQGCLGGTVGACERTANRFKTGTEGVAKDILTAASYLRRGCDSAEKSACIALDAICIENPELPVDVCAQALIHSDLFYEAEYQMSAGGDVDLIDPDAIVKPEPRKTPGSVSVADVAAQVPTKIERGKLDADLVVDVVLDRARQAAIKLVVDELLTAERKARYRYLRDLLEQGASLLADPSTLRREKFQDLGMTVVRAFVASNLIDGLYPSGAALLDAKEIGPTVKKHQKELGIHTGELNAVMHGYLVDVAYYWLGHTRLFGQPSKLSQELPVCPWGEHPLCTQLNERATAERAIGVEKVLDGLRLAKALRDGGFEDIRRLIEASSRSRTIANLASTPGLTLDAWQRQLVQSSRSRLDGLRESLSAMRALTRASAYAENGVDLPYLKERAIFARGALGSPAIRIGLGQDNVDQVLRIVRLIERADRELSTGGTGGGAVPPAGSGSPTTSPGSLDLGTLVMTNLRKDVTAGFVTWGTRDMVEFSVGSSRVDLQACKLEYSIVSPK